MGFLSRLFQYAPDTTEFPLAKIVQNHVAELKASQTPDRAVLEDYEFLWLFVYDQLKRDLPGYPLIQNSVYGGKGFTQKNFVMTKQDLGSASKFLPFETNVLDNDIDYMKLGELRPIPAKIRGEFHLVTPDVLINLDSYRDNTVEFIRKRCRIVIPYRQRTRKTVGELRHYALPCYTYVANPDYWGEIVDLGYDFKTVPMFTPKNMSWPKKYYHVRKND